MFLTLFILNQLLLPGQKPVAVFHQPTVQGIVIHDYPEAPVATFKVVEPKGIVLHSTPVKGIVLHPNPVTPVATFTFDNSY